MKLFINLFLTASPICAAAFPLHEHAGLNEDPEAPVQPDKRSVTLASLPQIDTQAQQTTLANTLSSCNTLTTAALNALAVVTEPNFSYIFRTDDAGTRAAVRTNFLEIQHICSQFPGDPAVFLFSTEELFYAVNPPPPGQVAPQDCDGAIWGVTFGQGIIFCDPFYNDYPPLPTDCWETSQTGILIHTLLHLPMITNGDPDDYADDGFLGDSILTAPVGQRPFLPDAYQYYASNVFNHCVNGESPADQPQPPVTPDDPEPSLCSSSSCSDASLSTLEYGEDPPPGDSDQDTS